jgi:hypothetical protein
MKVTNSLPILALATVAWMAAGPLVPAAEPPRLATYQSGDLQPEPDSVPASPYAAPLMTEDCQCQGQADWATDCDDAQCAGPAAGRGLLRNGLRHVAQAPHRPHSLANGLYYGMHVHEHSGQPLIDPWGRADYIAQQRAARQSWHAGYYHTQYCAPVALMVPPTARMQTRWSWGVAQSTMSPIYQQFERPYPGPVGSGLPGSGTGGGLLPTPRWPSHTDQFGVYYVRGPW